MAGETLTPEQLKAYNETLAQQEVLTNRTAEANKTFSGIFNILGNVFDSSAESLKKFNTDLQNSREMIGKQIPELESLTGALGMFELALSDITIFTKFTDTSFTSFNSVKDGFDQLIQHVGGANSMLGKKFQPFGDAMGNLEQAQKLEQGFIGLAAATGNMGNLFEDAGTHLANTDDKVRNFNDLMRNTQDATGLTASQISEYTVTLGKIPGALDSLVKTEMSATTGMSGFEAAMKLASGTGRDQKEVIETMTRAYEDLPNSQNKITNSTQKGLEMFAMMSNASEVLGLRFSDTKKFLDDTANTFKMIGDNTAGATRVLAGFSGALQETGLTAKASADIVGGMVTAVGSLSMGTKALMSLRSGGPGGLQGAFQVENLLRQGKTDEVVKMMERSLKQQFGGRIVTQAEAGGSQEAAGQFMRQREMLKSGAFGSLAKDDASATRLLEAMAKGGSAGSAEIKKLSSGSGALDTGIARGNSIQERQTTLFTTMNSSLDRIASLTMLQTAIATRNAFGAGPEAAKMIASIRATASSQNRNMFGEGQTAFNKPMGDVEAQNKTARQASADLLQSIILTAAGGKDLVINAAGEAGKAVKGLNTLFNTNEPPKSEPANMPKVRPQSAAAMAHEQQKAATMKPVKSEVHVILHAPEDWGAEVTSEDGTAVSIGGVGRQSTQ